MQSSTRRCPSMSTFPASVNGVGAIGNTPAKDSVEDIKCNVYSDGGNRKSPATVEGSHASLRAFSRPAHWFHAMAPAKKDDCIDDFTIFCRPGAALRCAARIHAGTFETDPALNVLAGTEFYTLPEPPRRTRWPNTAKKRSRRSRRSCTKR